jgi:hypothetical protein
MHFHERLESLSQGGFATTHWPKQIEDLLALFQALGCVPEEADDPLNRFLHTVELGEGWIGADGPVHEDPSEPRILCGVD